MGEFLSRELLYSGNGIHCVALSDSGDDGDGMRKKSSSLSGHLDFYAGA